MKKERLEQYLNLLGIPALAAVCGLIVFFSPEAAAVLVAKIVGWLLVLGGAVKAISMAGKPSRPTSWIAPAIGIILGVVLLRMPMVLATTLGRFLGILLVARGADDLRKSNYSAAKVLGIITVAVGALLILNPLTLTRTVLRLCGAVVAIIGIVNILEKLREMKLLESGGKPNIIDADE